MLLLVNANIMDNVNLVPYKKGGMYKKVIGVIIRNGTAGTGEFKLVYGADVIATGISTTGTDKTITFKSDIQQIVDKRWCDANSEISCVVSEAPGATLKFIVGILEAGAYK